MKEKLCKKYFDNKIKPKHLSEFCEKTPEGNEISGYLCRKPNKFLGSIVITHITQKDGKSYDCEQFIQSFPKIHYWDDRHILSNEDDFILYHCQEKLDGTCLIIYPLKDDCGNLIEIIPKTRGRAVADEHILEMYNLIDKKAIKLFFNDCSKEYNDILMFELYGMLNRHEISHIDTYIDISLIGAYINGNFCDYFEIVNCDRLNRFKRPDIIYSITKYHDSNEFVVTWGYDCFKLEDYRIDIEDSFPTLYDAIQEVKSLLQQINNDYYEENGHRAVEGVVINGLHKNGTQMYLKVKPSDIEQEAKNRHGITRRFILKEVNKYFDEYGSKVREIYGEDETHYIDYVKRQLSEEFSFEQIEDPRTRKRIKKVFMDVWDSKLPSISLQNICDDLVRKYPDKSAGELMKIFANEYPSKKQKSRFVYNIFSKILVDC